MVLELALIGGVEVNMVKIGLGLVGIIYSIIFMFQHYCLYPKSETYEELE